MRLPSKGGEALLYSADSLLPLEWRIAAGVPAISRALGTDLEDRMVYAVDDRGRLIGFDLLARQSRIYLATAERLSATADGTVLGVDSSRHPLRFHNRSLNVFRPTVEGFGDSLVLARGRSGRIAAYAPKRGLVQILAEDAELRRYDVPDGRLESSWFGDLIAITTDSGILVIEPSDTAAPRFRRIEGQPLASAFSPSAHRLYVARARGDLMILDRFDEKLGELATLKLPGTARDLRPDRSGRWMLARPLAGDSIWLIDLVRRELVATMPSQWASDLPMVTGGRTLVLREGDDVVSFDIGGPKPAPQTRLNDAAHDIFLAVPWTPRTALQLAAAEPPRTLEPEPSAESASETELEPLTPALPEQPVTSGPPDSESPVDVYIQVSSSQNEGYARALAQQLGEIGFRASVLDPDGQPDAGYKVVIGPYNSRDAADADGKRLGKPYFLITPGSPEG